MGLTLDPLKQARRLCVLPGFNLGAHPAAPVVKRVWMGLGPDRANEGKTPDYSAALDFIREARAWSLLS